jgi:hypothetical protein
MHVGLEGVLVRRFNGTQGLNMSVPGNSLGPCNVIHQAAAAMMITFLGPFPALALPIALLMGVILTAVSHFRP